MRSRQNLKLLPAVFHGKYAASDCTYLEFIAFNPEGFILFRTLRNPVVGGRPRACRSSRKRFNTDSPANVLRMNRKYVSIFRKVWRKVDFNCHKVLRAISFRIFMLRTYAEKGKKFDSLVACDENEHGRDL